MKTTIILMVTTMPNNSLNANDFAALRATFKIKNLMIPV